MELSRLYLRLLKCLSWLLNGDTEYYVFSLVGFIFTKLR